MLQPVAEHVGKADEHRRVIGLEQRHAVGGRGGSGSIEPVSTLRQRNPPVGGGTAKQIGVPATAKVNQPGGWLPQVQGRRWERSEPRPRAIVFVPDRESTV